MALGRDSAWHFEVQQSAARSPPPDRVEWEFKLPPYAGEPTPPKGTMPIPHEDYLFGTHRPVHLEARLFIGGACIAASEKDGIVQGGHKDKYLASLIDSVTHDVIDLSSRENSSGLAGIG